MKKNLEAVVSRQEVEVLTLEEELAMEKDKNKILQTENEILQKKMEKYKFLAKAHRKALRASLADRSLFAKRATELERKVLPHGFLEKLLFLLKN